MKNLLKLSLLIAGICLTANVNAQTGVKTPAIPATPVTAKQDTTKKVVPPTPGANAVKQTPSPAPGTPGAQKMAINEQGVPTKMTPSKKAGVTDTPNPPAAEMPKKKE